LIRKETHNIYTHQALGNTSQGQKLSPNSKHFISPEGGTHHLGPNSGAPINLSLTMFAKKQNRRKDESWTVPEPFHLTPRSIPTAPNPFQLTPVRSLLALVRSVLALVRSSGLGSGQSGRQSGPTGSVSGLSVPESGPYGPQSGPLWALLRSVLALVRSVLALVRSSWLGSGQPGPSATPWAARFNG
jgi:hypothetical protein